jgi:hypothetical protein
MMFIGTECNTQQALPLLRAIHYFRTVRNGIVFFDMVPLNMVRVWKVLKLLC